MHMVVAIGAKMLTAASAAASAAGSAASTVASTIGSTVATSGATAGATGGGGFLSFGNLSAASNVLSGMSAFSSALQQKNNLQEQAYGLKLQGGQDAINAAREANDVLDRAIGTSARQRVAFSAAGVGQGGTAGRIVDQDMARAQSDIDLINLNQRTRSYMTRRKIRSLNSQGRGVARAGLLQLGASGVQAGADIRNRGI